MSYTEDFFQLNRWILRSAGLWRPTTPNKLFQTAYTIYSIFVFLFVNLWFTFSEFLSLFYTYKEEDELIKNVNFFLTHFMGALKVIFWYFFGDKLQEIMIELEQPRWNYQACDGFQPNAIISKYKNIGRKYTLMFFLMAHATLISSYIPPTITAFSHLKSSNHSSKLPDKLPYYSWMPFSYDTGPKYLYAVAYQAGPMFSYAYSVVGMDSLFMNLMNCIAGHVTVLQGAFRNIRERCVATPRGVDLHEKPPVMKAMNKEMKKCIRHLQMVFKTCETLENLHRYVTLCQITATLFILCTSLYLVSSASPFSKQFLIELVYMAAMCFQLVLYCWFGNEVTLKFQELPKYMWESDWLATDNYFKKCMMFTMLRARRPVYFTAGKFSQLTLPTFMAIIKTSYSIFALIKNK